MKHLHLLLERRHVIADNGGVIVASVCLGPQVEPPLYPL